MTIQSVQNTWDAAKCRAVSDNYNAVMGRTWYCIASNLPVQAEQDIFWEHNTWVAGKEGRKFHNHTVTRKRGEKLKDYGTWYGMFVDGRFAMRPTLTILGLAIGLPVKVVTNWLTFPKDLSKDAVWTYYGIARGQRITFVWALTPHLADAVFQAESQRLERENGLTEQLYKVQWDAGYKLGDTGEPINQL